MLTIVRQALMNGVATNAYPDVAAEPPAGFRGKPVIDFVRCTACDECAAVCPTGAISVLKQGKRDEQKVVSMNYGDCISCGECEAVCPDVVHLTKEFQLAVSKKIR